MKIADAYPGREDGSYTLLFGNIKLGSLISAVHATAIRMGNELERLVHDRVVLIDANNLQQFIDRTLPEGVYVIPKQVLMTDSRLRFDECPDMICVDTKANTCLVVELKLGDNFDTKKANGEVNALRRYAAKLNMAIPYRVSYAVCMFTALNTQAVIAGFKNRITDREALTGKQFCDLLGISFPDILMELQATQHENVVFLLKKIKEIEAQL